MQNVTTFRFVMTVYNNFRNVAILTRSVLHRQAYQPRRQPFEALFYCSGITVLPSGEYQYIAMGMKIEQNRERGYG